MKKKKTKKKQYNTQSKGYRKSCRRTQCTSHSQNIQGKIKELCQDIHSLRGNKKIIESFLVEVDFKNESFVIKSIKCLSNFINQDYSAKAWNRSNHFASFAARKKINHYLLKTIDLTDLVNVH